MIDTSTSQIIARWKAPPLTFDVAFDDATGKLWAVSERRGSPPRIWEMSADDDPVLRHKLTNDFDSVNKGDALDYGAIAIDSTARRGAFTSPRSEQLALLDLDSGEVIHKLTSDYLPHATVFDTRRGIGYATSGAPYAFRSSDGELLGYDLCAPGFGGPPLILSSAGVLYAPKSPWFDDPAYVCAFDPDTGASLLEINIGWAPRGGALSPDGTRLYLANPEHIDFDLASGVYTSVFTVVDVRTLDGVVVHDFSGPHGFEMSLDGTRLFVTQTVCNRISVYDSTPFRPVHLYDIEMDGETLGMDLSADGSRLFVAQVDPKGPLGHGEEFLDPDDERDDDCPPLVPPP